MAQDNFPHDGLVRLSQIVNIPHKKIGFIPVSKSTWWQWVKDGLAPRPVKLGKNVTAWRAQDVRKLALEMGRSSG